MQMLNGSLSDASLIKNPPRMNIAYADDCFIAAAEFDV